VCSLSLFYFPPPVAVRLAEYVKGGAGKGSRGRAQRPLHFFSPRSYWEKGGGRKKKVFPGSNKRGKRALSNTQRFHLLLVHRPRGRGRGSKKAPELKGREEKDGSAGQPAS